MQGYRFSGADEPKKLSKIGGQYFSAVKNKVRDSKMPYLYRGADRRLLPENHFLCTSEIPRNAHAVPANYPLPVPAA